MPGQCRRSRAYLPSLTPSRSTAVLSAAAHLPAAPSLPSCSLPAGIDHRPVFAIAAPLWARSVRGGLAFASLLSPSPSSSTPLSFLLHPLPLGGSNLACWHHLPFHSGRLHHKRGHSSPCVGRFRQQTIQTPCRLPACQPISHGPGWLGQRQGSAIRHPLMCVSTQERDWRRSGFESRVLQMED